MALVAVLVHAPRSARIETVRLQHLVVHPGKLLAGHVGEGGGVLVGRVGLGVGPLVVVVDMRKARVADYAVVAHEHIVEGIGVDRLDIVDDIGSDGIAAADIERGGRARHDAGIVLVAPAHHLHKRHRGGIERGLFRRLGLILVFICYGQGQFALFGHAQAQIADTLGKEVGAYGIDHVVERHHRGDDGARRERGLLAAHAGHRLLLVLAVGKVIVVQRVYPHPPILVLGLGVEVGSKILSNRRQGVDRRIGERNLVVGLELQTRHRIPLLGGAILERQDGAALGNSAVVLVVLDGVHPVGLGLGAQHHFVEGGVEPAGVGGLPVGPGPGAGFGVGGLVEAGLLVVVLGCLPERIAGLFVHRLQPQILAVCLLLLRDGAVDGFKHIQGYAALGIGHLGGEIVVGGGSARGGGDNGLDDIPVHVHHHIGAAYRHLLGHRQIDEHEFGHVAGVVEDGAVDIGMRDRLRCKVAILNCVFNLGDVVGDGDIRMRLDAVGHDGGRFLEEPGVLVGVEGHGLEVEHLVLAHRLVGHVVAIGVVAAGVAQRVGLRHHHLPVVGEPVLVGIPVHGVGADQDFFVVGKAVVIDIAQERLGVVGVGVEHRLDLGGGDGAAGRAGGIVHAAAGQALHVLHAAYGIGVVVAHVGRIPEVVFVAVLHAVAIGIGLGGIGGVLGRPARGGDPALQRAEEFAQVVGAVAGLIVALGSKAGKAHLLRRHHIVVEERLGNVVIVQLLGDGLGLAVPVALEVGIAVLHGHELVVERLVLELQRRQLVGREHVVGGAVLVERLLPLQARARKFELVELHLGAAGQLVRRVEALAEAADFHGGGERHARALPVVGYAGGHGAARPHLGRHKVVVAVVVGHGGGGIVIEPVLVQFVLLGVVVGDAVAVDVAHVVLGAELLGEHGGHVARRIVLGLLVGIGETHVLGAVPDVVAPGHRLDAAQDGAFKGAVFLLLLEDPGVEEALVDAAAFEDTVVGPLQIVGHAVGVQVAADVLGIAHIGHAVLEPHHLGVGHAVAGGIVEVGDKRRLAELVGNAHARDHDRIGRSADGPDLVAVGTVGAEAALGLHAAVAEARHGGERLP